MSCHIHNLHGLLGRFYCTLLESTVIKLYHIFTLKVPQKVHNERLFEIEHPKRYQNHILTPKRYYEHPRHFFLWEYPSGGGGGG